MLNLIQKWVNRETKAKLRAENERLRSENDCLRAMHEPIIHTVEREVQKFSCRYMVDKMNPVPEEVVKRTILSQIVCDLESFVEWECEDDVIIGGVVYTGSIYIAKRK